MNGRRLARIIAIFFLVQSLSPSYELFAGTFTLNPPSKVSLTEPQNLSFRQEYGAIHLGLFIYKLDAIERCPKSHIKEILSKDYEDAFFEFSGVRFDLENIDMGQRELKKAGWTRYYPFSIGNKSFVMRICLKDEARYQRDNIEVLYEYTEPFGNPAVTVQILPSLNTLLKDCKIKPNSIDPDPQAGRSP